MVDKIIPNIFGNAIKEARIAKGIEINELANTLCLSAKHISQIEEGGDSAFFSKSHKVQVAKKLGAHLGLTEEQIVNTSNSQDAEVQTDEHSANLETEGLDSIGELEKLGNTNLESKSYKKIGILLVVAIIITVAAYLFLRSGSTAVETSEQVNNTSQEPVKTEPTPIDKSAIVEDSNVPCDIVPQNVTAFKVPKANSPGNFVYIVSRADQTICLIDGRGNKQLVKLIDQEKRNVIGIQPFTILSPDFKKVDIYYQGWKVPVTANTTTIRTEEQSNKSDSFLNGDSSNTDQK